MPYILDTNIISEIMKPHADHAVLCWMQDHVDELYLTSVTLMELNYGVMRLPEGKRKRLLRETLDALSREESKRTYAFDAFSAYLCAQMRCEAAASGLTPQLADCMIAAICKRYDCVLATRNVKDFQQYDIQVIDPFEYESPVLRRLKRRED